MSRGQRARTPDNFPRMKHRAAGRLVRKRGHNKMTLTEALDVFAALGKFVSDGVNALAYAFSAIGRAFRPEPTKADFALLPPGIEPLSQDTADTPTREHPEHP